MKRFTLKKSILYLIGLTFLAVCVTLIQKTNLGMSSWDALNRNFYEGIPLDYKYLTPIFALIVISFAYLIQRKKPSLWMLFPIAISFYIGFLIDLFLVLIPSVVDASIWFNLLYLTLSIIICSIGLNFILYCEYPLPALDELCFGIAKKRNISFGKGKFIGEVIALGLTILAGLLFQHQSQWFFIGPTTIIFAFFIGYVIDLFKKPIYAMLERVMK